MAVLLTAYDVSEEGVHHRQSQMEANAYFESIKRASDSLKARLASSKEPEVTSPGWLHSYNLDMWGEIPFPPKGWMTDQTKIKIAAQISGLPEYAREYIDYKLTYEAYYVPYVRYEVVTPPPSPRSKGHLAKLGMGVPALVWRLAVYIITTIEFWETDGTLRIERYDFIQNIRFMRENIGRMFAGPEFWSYQTAFVTPVSFLALLAWEKIEMPGVEVLRLNPPWTTFRIGGFQAEITLHADFRRFIRDMAKKTPLDKALLDRGMCDKETALLVKAKLEKLQKPEAPAAGPPKPKGPGIETGDDFQDILTALQGLGYAKAEAMPAAKHICGKFPNETLVDKIKLALKYLGQ